MAGVVERYLKAVVDHDWAALADCMTRRRGAGGPVRRHLHPERAVRGASWRAHAEPGGLLHAGRADRRSRHGGGGRAHRDASRWVETSTSRPRRSCSTSNPTGYLEGRHLHKEARLTIPARVRTAGLSGRLSVSGASALHLDAPTAFPSPQHEIRALQGPVIEVPEAHRGALESARGRQPLHRLEALAQSVAWSGASSGPALRREAGRCRTRRPPPAPSRYAARSRVAVARVRLVSDKVST